MLKYAQICKCLELYVFKTVVLSHNLKQKYYEKFTLACGRYLHYCLVTGHTWNFRGRHVHK